MLVNFVKYNESKSSEHVLRGLRFELDHCLKNKASVTELTGSSGYNQYSYD